MTAEIRSTL